MKLNGTHKFHVTSSQVYNAILNPTVLQECIPGCESVEYLDANRIKANITTPLPGLKGPYGVVIKIQENQGPNRLILQVQRKGTGGSVRVESRSAGPNACDSPRRSPESASAARPRSWGAEDALPRTPAVRRRSRDVE